jgi:hypothetical protein
MKDALGHGSDPQGGTNNVAAPHARAWYHGSPTGFPGLSGPIHVGTYVAARQALEARIGVPADGKGWDGTREYGKTLLAGKDTLEAMESGQRPYYNKWVQTGYNSGSDVPRHDYYPKERESAPTMGNSKSNPGGTPVTDEMRPAVRAYQINGPMNDKVYSDTMANRLASTQSAKGNGKNGFYYKNDGEDSGSISAVVPSYRHLTGLTE